jgi:hypothetical protein
MYLETNHAEPVPGISRLKSTGKKPCTQLQRRSVRVSNKRPCFGCERSEPGSFPLYSFGSERYRSCVSASASEPRCYPSTSSASQKPREEWVTEQPDSTW